MKTDWQAAVLGLGGIGSGALYWLARRLGGDVLGVEQFALGHDRGGSHDHSRIIRLSYHTPAYVALAAAAYDAWSEVESEAGERLVHSCGGLDLFPFGGAIPMADYTASLAARAVPFEVLAAAEIRARWPQFRRLDGVTGLFQERGGLVAAARATAAHQRLAREHGAALVERAAVAGVSQVGDEVEITVDGVRHRAGRLVVAAGAWSNRVLAGLGLRLPLAVTQEQVTYFAARDLDRFAMDRFPIWIWMDEPCFYGFPVFGEQGVKVAQDVGGPVVSAETRSFEPDRGALARARGFLARHLPAALGPELFTKTCLYTLTPDRDFVVDRLPEAPGVWLAIGAGHAFKFASVLGRCLSELALDGATAADLEAFRIGRPVLWQDDPPTSYLI
ncbi:MAG: N-methyl-L-tryptophan oxidase [Acidobacteriota bacterium]|nr:N-methyl-L-tryptophan oxidase [Acidobacteriota bacterium]MDH3524034.1 N-methyl-L-tryptophan oxidase [Acidobacteriota bacterium]